VTLIRTSLLNGIAVVVKILTLLGLNKILAIYVGPAGYASIGQFQNAVQIVTTLASGAINTGVTKYTAEYHEDESKQHAVWRTAATISLIGSVSVSIIVVAFNKQFAVWFLKDQSLSSVFTWFALSLIFFVINAFLLSILNGKKEIHRYVISNIIGSLFALAVTALMAIQWGLYGTLVALAIYQSLNFFVTLALTYKTSWFKIRYFLGDIDKQAAKNLAKFSTMALTSVVCTPVCHIMIRDHLGENLGWEAAGYWEAMWRLSSAYLMLVTTTLSVYYLPKLAEIVSANDIKKEILQGYKIILPVTTVSGLGIYLFRDYIIQVLFSSEFYDMRILFHWQVIGDVLKIGSWVLSYLMLSKAMVGLFVFSEILFTTTFYLLSTFLIYSLGLEGVSIAHALNYAAYWIFMIIAIMLKLRKVNN
jgi:PST family polysaccharide transporter